MAHGLTPSPIYIAPERRVADLEEIQVADLKEVQVLKVQVGLRVGLQGRDTRLGSGIGFSRSGFRVGLQGRAMRYGIGSRVGQSY